MLKTVNMMYILPCQKKIENKLEVLWVFLIKVSITFLLSPILFLWGLSFSEHMGFCILVSKKRFFPVFSLFHDLFCYPPRKIRMVVTIYPVWVALLCSGCTSESPGSFQSPFAQAIPYVNDIRICESSLSDLKVEHSQDWECLPWGKPCWI